MNIMNSKYIIFFLSIALSFSLMGCCVLAYLWIDRSITLSYVNQSYETSNNIARNLTQLIESEWHGLSESVIRKKLENAAQRHSDEKILVKFDKNEGVIWFEDSSFNFNNGYLSKINGIGQQ
jgi:hypothetical protein